MSADLETAARSVCLARYQAVHQVMKALATLDACDEAICEGLAHFPGAQQDQIIAAMEAQNEFLEEALTQCEALAHFARITFTDPAEEAEQPTQQPEPQ